LTVTEEDDDSDDSSYSDIQGAMPTGIAAAANNAGGIAAAADNAGGIAVAADNACGIAAAADNTGRIAAAADNAGRIAAAADNAGLELIATYTSLLPSYKAVLGIRIRSDLDLFVGSGNFDRIRIPDPDPTPLPIRKGDFFTGTLTFSVRYLSFSANHKKNFRTFGQNYYVKQRHFELFPKSGGFYSLGRIRDQDPVFSEVGSGQNGPDPPTLVQIEKLPVTRQFRCSKCSYLFTQYNDLRSHMRTQSGKKLCRYSKFSQLFLRSTSLRKHKRTHTA
jgi:hypothetical protein